MDNAEEIYTQELFNRLAKLQAAVEAYASECGTYQINHKYPPRIGSDVLSFNRLKAALEASKGGE